jgi:molecular chaperone GrpE
VSEEKKEDIKNEEVTSEEVTEEKECCKDEKCCEDSSEETKESNDNESKEDKNWEQEYNNLNEQYIRAYAEMENTKKRYEKEKYNAIDFSIEKFAKDLLPCMDSLDMAIASTNNSEANPEELLKTLKEGIDLTINNFVKALEKNGVEIIDTDDGFDPNFHQGVMKEQSEDHESGQIVKVLQKGYKLKDRVLRASMVSVCE